METLVIPEGTQVEHCCMATSTVVAACHSVVWPPSLYLFQKVINWSGLRRDLVH